MLNFCWVITFLDILFFNILWIVNISDLIKNTVFWKSMMRSFRWIEVNALIYLGFFLMSAPVCKKCTILGNYSGRAITQERRKEIRQMTPIFSSTFWALTVFDIYFCIWKLLKFIFKGFSFCAFWSAKYLNFGDVSCEIKNFSRSIQETYTFYFFFPVEKKIYLISCNSE